MALGTLEGWVESMLSAAFVAAAPMEVSGMPF